MTNDILAIIEEGPPGGLITRFTELFSEKKQLKTQAIEKDMAELGWN